jgi:hypothetical protein
MQVVAAVPFFMLVGLTAPADAPYFGKWTFNQAKSDFGTARIVFRQIGEDIEQTALGRFVCSGPCRS